MSGPPVPASGPRMCRGGQAGQAKAARVTERKRGRPFGVPYREGVTIEDGDHLGDVSHQLCRYAECRPGGPALQLDRREAFKPKDPPAVYTACCLEISRKEWKPHPIFSGELSTFQAIFPN